MQKSNYGWLMYRALILAALFLTSVIAAADGPYGDCPAPNKPGVNVCYPHQGNFGESPVQIIAAGTGAKGPVRVMELWADGQKVGEVGGNLFDEPIKLSTGERESSSSRR